MKPRWMKRHIACPSCGHICKEPGDKEEKRAYATYGRNRMRNGFTVRTFKRKGVYYAEMVSFDCPVCKAHWPIDDFWEEQHEKWDRTMKEEA